MKLFGQEIKFDFSFKINRIKPESIEELIIEEQIIEEPVFVKRYGNWFKGYKCHCDYIDSKNFELCPKCGCLDGPKEVICRTEWEENESLFNYKAKNRKVVIWSECTKENL